MRLRVATLNCWNVSEPFEKRMALIHAGVAALQPDVIALQEIVVRRDGFDQAGMILDGLGYDRRFGPAFCWEESGRLLPPEHPDAGAFGNVVASRWPIRRSELRALPGVETGERRSVLATLIETPAGTLPFFTTHLNWKYHHGYVRERQVVEVTDFIRQFAAGPLPPTLAGDLNAEPESTEIRFLCGLATLGGRSVYFQDAWRRAADGGPGFTWDNQNHFAAYSCELDRRIDYILVGLPAERDGRGWIESARLAFAEPAGTVFASDHFGVVADIRM